MPCDFRIPCLLLLLFSLFARLAQSFYIPGFSIKSYRDGEPIPLFVNKVYSDNTQLQYAYAELPFVCPASGRKRASTNLISGSSVSLNLGEILRGDRITVSDYELTMGRDDDIHFLCSQVIDREAMAKAKEIIRDGYVSEWIVDNLPSATQFVTVDRSRKYYAAGFKLGYIEDEDDLQPDEEPRYFINNHMTLVLRYNRAPGTDGQHGRKVIVGFEVYPKSVELGDRDKDGLPKDIHNTEYGLELTMKQNITSRIAKRLDSTYGLTEDDEDEDDGATMVIPYTYSVYFREEETVQWHNRWDLYFVNQDESSSIHWLAIVNSIVIAGLLAGVVAVILGRTISSDIKSRRELGDDSKKRIKAPVTPRRSMEKDRILSPLNLVDGLPQDDGSDDEVDLPEDVTGWKVLHSDVFRGPPNGVWLPPLVGSGIQLLFMAFGLIVLSCFGVLNPSFRGGYASVGTGLFVFAGIFSGYYSARMYKTFGGQSWQKNALVTASLLPGLLFGTTFILNLFVWAQASSTALPFGTLISLVALWVLIQLPLVYVGALVGYSYHGAYRHPIEPNAIPRQVPARSASWAHLGVWSPYGALLSGVVPFVVIFIELMFVFQNIWQDKSGYYYVFGFLAVVSALLVITVMEVTIVAVYLQLSNENYHWWWQSFLTGSSSSVWIFAYCVYYYVYKLHITGVLSSLLFFSYSLLACTMFGLLMGTIGFLTAYTFVRRIYGAIKID